MLLKNGIDLQSKLSEYISNSQNLFIYSPYIKLETLKALIDGQKSIKAVFVRWETRDLILGSSDLEIYPFLRDRGIALYRNTRLHLKAYVDEYKKCLLTSANISARALNMPTYGNYNYEIGTLVDNLDLDDRLYLNIIESDSTLITDNIYNQFKEQLPKKKKEFPNEDEFFFKIEALDKHFLISSLPMTYSVETLYRIYEDKEFISDVELNCALHDLAIYKIPLGLESSEFKKKLKESFFNHPFIKGFLENLNANGEVYFGAAKEWIHKNCADVPTPRKWEITENIQILYRWVVKLSNGEYAADQPNYSERLRKT
ncbi:MAG: phospholipase D-like domain-containing protein [Bacteroidia bacterium]